MALVRFSIEADTNDVEPDRIIPKIDGEIFDEPGEDSESSVGPKIGHVHALLVLWNRAANEGVSLYDAMDCFSASAEECFAALYREDGQEWSKAVNELYDGDVPGMDALFIEEIQLEPKYRGQGIGADIVRELISTFASTGIALVACKPFPLQYLEWKADDAEHRKLRETPGFEEKRIADFARVAQFWTELGFRKLKDCDVFYTYAPHLRVQPEIPRVPRGRRRLQNKSVAPRRK